MGRVTSLIKYAIDNSSDVLWKFYCQLESSKYDASVTKTHEKCQI